MNDETVQPENNIGDGGVPESGSVSRRQILFRVIGLVLITLAIVLGVYGMVAYVAWQRGQAERVENLRLALEDELEKQLDFARSDVEAGNFALALRRLDWILERNPAYSGASSLRQEAQSGLDARLTPTVLPPPTATSSALVEDQGPSEAEISQTFTELEQLIEDEDWQAALEAISLFQSEFPAYRRHDTDTMLYNTYINLGIELLKGDQVELGLFYLAQAEKLGDLPAEATDYQTWAELYLLGIGYFGVDWGTTLYYFRGLCAAAPYYQNACARLRQALIAYGDQYATQADWCPAENLFAEARAIERSEDLDEKLKAARDFCREATPTPAAPVTDTLPFSDTLPAASNIQ